MDLWRVHQVQHTVRLPQLFQRLRHRLAHLQVGRNAVGKSGRVGQLKLTHPFASGEFQRDRLQIARLVDAAARQFVAGFDHVVFALAVVPSGS